MPILPIFMILTINFTLSCNILNYIMVTCVLCISSIYCVYRQHHHYHRIRSTVSFAANIRPSISKKSLGSFSFTSLTVDIQNLQGVGRYSYQ